MSSSLYTFVDFSLAAKVGQSFNTYFLFWLLEF